MGSGRIKTEVDFVNEDIYRVTAEIDGISAYTFCSSMHLVDDKVKQLTLCIQEQARKAYLEGFDNV
jgi:hypothetical protein